MTRFVLRSRGADGSRMTLSRLEAEPDVRVLDRVDNRLALVELPERTLPRVKFLLPGWSIEREQDVDLPGTWPGATKRRSDDSLDYE